MRAKTVCREIERRGGVVVRTTRSHWRLVVRWKGNVALVRVPTRWVSRETLRSIERQLEPAFGERWLDR